MNIKFTCLLTNTSKVNRRYLQMKGIRFITEKDLKIWRRLLVGFRSLVEEDSTCWVLVNSLNLQNELMDVHQSDISKMQIFSTSNLVSFMFTKSCHFMWAYHVLLHKTSHTSCVLFFFWFLRAGSRESTPSVSSR